MAIERLQDVIDIVGDNGSVMELPESVRYKIVGFVTRGVQRAQKTPDTLALTDDEVHQVFETVSANLHVGQFNNPVLAEVNTFKAA